jgi:hypothetical protein
MVCSWPAMESAIKRVGGQVSPTLSSKDCYDNGHVHQATWDKERIGGYVVSLK